MHRLTQAILRDRFTPARVAAASDPGDLDNPVTWPRWARLMPHLLAADLGATGHRRLRSIGCNACGYLLARRDTSSGHDLASDLRQHWRDRFGEDRENTLAAATYLAWALRAMGRRGRYPPHKCPHKRTLIGTTGRWLALDGRIKPEQADDQRERLRGRLLALPGTPRRPSHNCQWSRRGAEPAKVPGIGVSAGQRGSEWSGAGSNRRPSAFQGSYHP